MKSKRLLDLLIKIIATIICVIPFVLNYPIELKITSVVAGINLFGITFDNKKIRNIVAIISLIVLIYPAIHLFRQ